MGGAAAQGEPARQAIRQQHQLAKCGQSAMHLLVLGMCLRACLLQVRPIAEDEMFKVMKSGKRRKKSWKRMVTKVTFVGQGFTRKPPKYERFIRPSGLCAHLLAGDLQIIRHRESAWVLPATDDVSALQYLCLSPLSPELLDVSWPAVSGLPASTQRSAAGLRMNKANVTHPELKCTFQLEIVGVK